MTKRNRQILTYPNPHLREEAARVERFDDELNALFEEMCVLMHQSEGVGLAATQVGESIKLLVLSSYVFLSEDERRARQAEGDTADMGEDIAVINPEIIEESDELTVDYEGCLSFPEVYIKVKRPLWVKIKAQRLDGSEFELYGEGFGARAILHEIDHLTGKVMTDHLSFLDRQKAMRDHKKIQRRRQHELGETEEERPARAQSSHGRRGAHHKNKSKRGSKTKRRR